MSMLPSLWSWANRIYIPRRIPVIAKFFLKKNIPTSIFQRDEQRHSISLLPENTTIKKQGRWFPIHLRQCAANRVESEVQSTLCSKNTIEKIGGSPSSSVTEVAIQLKTKRNVALIQVNDGVNVRM